MPSGASLLPAIQGQRAGAVSLFLPEKHQERAHGEAARARGILRGKRKRNFEDLSLLPAGWRRQWVASAAVFGLGDRGVAAPLRLPTATGFASCSVFGLHKGLA